MVTERLNNIHILRGLASLAVCWAHMTAFHPISSGKEPIQALGSFGVYGVQIFFIISGYVIPRSLHQSQYKLKRMGSYILRRSIRLDPPYYLSIFLVIGLTLLIQVTSFYQGPILEFESRRILSHFLYITMIIGENWVNDVYWTLGIEFQYYFLIGLIFPLLMTRFRFPLILLLCTATWFTPSEVERIWISYWFPLFSIGILTYFHMALIVKKRIYYASLLALVFFCFFKYDKLPITVVALTTPLIILYLEPRNPPRILNFFGNISYSLYLVHLPIGSRIVNFGGRFVSNVPSLLALATLATSISIAASYVFYILVERPSQKLSQKIKVRSKQIPQKT